MVAIFVKYLMRQSGKQLVWSISAKVKFKSTTFWIMITQPPANEHIRIRHSCTKRDISILSALIFCVINQSVWKTQRRQLRSHQLFVLNITFYTLCSLYYPFNFLMIKYVLYTEHHDIQSIIPLLFYVNTASDLSIWHRWPYLYHSLKNIWQCILYSISNISVWSSSPLID